MKTFPKQTVYVYKGNGIITISFLPSDIGQEVLDAVVSIDDKGFLTIEGIIKKVVFCDETCWLHADGTADSLSGIITPEDDEIKTSTWITGRRKYVLGYVTTKRRLDYKYLMSPGTYIIKY